MKLKAFAELGNKKVNVRAVMDDLIKRMRLRDLVAKALRESSREDEFGFDETQMGIVNALSRLATHSPLLSPATQCRLTEAAGVLSQAHVHRCPKCFSVVYRTNLN